MLEFVTMTKVTNLILLEKIKANKDELLGFF